MRSAELFGGGDGPKRRKSEPAGRARVERAERHQFEMRPSRIDDLLPADHRARLFWSACERLDLSAFYAKVASRESSAGRPAIDPLILIVLWLYATSEHVGSARELERRCESQDAYKWICGGVSVNHHSLSDFRVEHEAGLDELFTQILGSLLKEDVITLRRVAQDGTRVRASAGAASFRREKTIQECLGQARNHVKAMKRLLMREVGERAKERERELRLAERRKQGFERALEHLRRLRERSEKQGDEGLRVSTSDPEARVMKMPDGGFRPAYNVQLATDTDSRVIVGVRVSDRGNDAGEMKAMLAEIAERTGSLPKAHLVDGGYATHANVEAAAEAGVALLAPPTQPRDKERDRYKPMPKDSQAVAAWRRRMGSQRGRATYKLRAATAETVNADLKTWRGLARIHVRGIAKVKCLALWSALAYNLMRCVELGALG
jgi:transposase